MIDDLINLVKIERQIIKDKNLSLGIFAYSFLGILGMWYCVGYNFDIKETHQSTKIMSHKNLELFSECKKIKITWQPRNQNPRILILPIQ